jgi:hypothetical protein
MEPIAEGEIKPRRPESTAWRTINPRISLFIELLLPEESLSIIAGHSRRRNSFKKSS